MSKHQSEIALYMMDELSRSQELCGPFNSRHEGYAVMLEEMDELWEEIKKKEPDEKRMEAEAIQIGAMAMRFIYDLC